MTGFSLIELMVAVTIAAIVMAIAIPSYTQYTQRGRRAAAQSCLIELSQFMERFYTTNLAYVTGTPPVPPTLPTLTCRQDLIDFYTFDFTAAPTATTYSLQASVVDPGAQADDMCGDMTLTNTGARTPLTDGCWQ